MCCNALKIVRTYGNKKYYNFQIPTGRGIPSKPLIIGNQYAQEFEPEYKEPVKLNNNQAPVVITPSVNFSPSPTGQVTTDTYQRLQASPPPPSTAPYIPPGKINNNEVLKILRF